MTNSLDDIPPLYDQIGYHSIHCVGALVFYQKIYHAINGVPSPFTLPILAITYPNLMCFLIGSTVKNKIIRLVLPCVAIASLIGCFGAPIEIEEAQKIVKNALIDGESAQFSDVEFYKSTKYVCGVINAKNKMGGYDGKKKFIVSLGDRQSAFDPDRNTPAPPKPSTDVTPESFMSFQTDAAAWIAKSSEVSSAAAAFDKLIATKCTNTPKQSEETVEKAEKLGKLKKAEFVYSDASITIPSEFLGDDLSFIAEKVAKVTLSKGVSETTNEYNKRMSVLSFDPSPADFGRLYSIKITTDPYGAQRSTDYDADKGLLSVSYQGFLTDGHCKEDDDVPNKAEHPIICFAGNKNYLAISNRNSLLKRHLKGRSNMFEKRNYDLVDSFSYPRDKISSLQESNSSSTYNLGVATLLIGKIIKDQKNPFHAVAGAKIPFDLKYIVHYDAKTGEILATRRSQ